MATSMFDLPDAKRVRRDELISPAPPSPPREVLSKNGYERLRQLLDYDPLAFSEPSGNVEQSSDADNEGARELEQGFDFRLFSVPMKSMVHDSNELDVETNERPGCKNNDAGKFNDGTRKLQIYSPSPGPVVPSEGRFVVPHRGWQHYVTTPSILSEGSVGINASLKRREYEDVAVTGEQILNWEKRGTWPGCHLPWRIIHLNKSHVKRQVSSLNLDFDKLHIDSAPANLAVKARKKAGKKRRVALRNQAAADNATKAKVAGVEKRKSKNREKNRERKIKRRQKKRGKKAAMPATATAGGIGGDGDIVMTVGSH
ncbi:hypothetical protein Egran_02858 [Elaphomyces granulatus]|uniref:Uncharacterized protein n=1 Tax=Elaphomyces granulatus TaxID=519963 RepID=A0A232LZ56_9EURO|nr:hypothetical protein Egran_02858 [Elaphomyces granulatus]